MVKDGSLLPCYTDEFIENDLDDFGMISDLKEVRSRDFSRIVIFQNRTPSEDV